MGGHRWRQCRSQVALVSVTGGASVGRSCWSSVSAPGLGPDFILVVEFWVQFSVTVIFTNCPISVFNVMF